jgi:hypothetical protein
LFEDLQNSDVCNAAGETSAQSDSDGWNPGRQNRGALAGELPPEGLY